MSGYERLYETHYVNRGVMVIKQALMSVLIIVQMIYEAAWRSTVVEQEIATVAASIRKVQTGSGEAAVADLQKEQTEKQVVSVAAAASIQRLQTGSKAAKPKAVAKIAKDVAVATGDQKTAKKAEDSAAAADKVAVDKAAADEAKTKAKAAVEEAEAVDAARQAAAEANKAKTEQTGMTHADGTRRKAASGEHAVIRRGERSTWPAVTVVDIAMGVLSMMMVTTSGAQAVEMASSDSSGYHYDSRGIR